MTAALPAVIRPRLTWRQRLLRLLPWHRRLALLACIGLLSWGVSGMLHALAHVLQPQPATQQPPHLALALDGLRAPAEVLGAADIGVVQGLRLLMLDGQPYYQARLGGHTEPRYWHARSGRESPLAARHAQVLAQHYLGSAEALDYRGSLARFDGEYGAFYRLLPVARVDSRRDDGLRLYLDLFNDRLGSLVDARKAWLGKLFQALHSLHWLDAVGPWRVPLLLLLLAAALAVTLIGIGLFVARRRARTATRRWHAWSGVGLALVTLSFVVSGAWHLLHKQRLAPAPEPFVARFAVAGLDRAPVWRAQGVRVDREPSLRYLDRRGHEMADDAPRRYAEQRLAHYAQALGVGAARSLSLQERFDEEYGFAFKRLPVFKARYADAAHTSLYIDPLDGALAARVGDAERAEGWSFRYLHTGALFDALGHVGKQWLLGLLALAQVLLALVGLALWRRRAGR